MKKIVFYKKLILNNFVLFLFMVNAVSGVDNTSSLVTSSTLLKNFEEYNLSIYYSGNKRSVLEPCHCSGRQLGGIDREAGFFNIPDIESSSHITIDSGGFLCGLATKHLLLKSLQSQYVSYH